MNSIIIGHVSNPAFHPENIVPSSTGAVSASGSPFGSSSDPNFVMSTGWLSSSSSNEKPFRLMMDAMRPFGAAPNFLFWFGAKHAKVAQSYLVGITRYGSTKHEASGEATSNGVVALGENYKMYAESNS
jgi:hypothetical protein